MKRTLDKAIRTMQSTMGPLEQLRAVVLSVSPDGLVAWCWSREQKPEIALGFAALDRAATQCLDGLGASRNLSNLLLRTQGVTVAAWPLYDGEERKPGREQLVLTTVFDGDLNGGYVMAYGMRVRAHIRKELDAARTQSCMQLRAKLIEFGLAAANPTHALRELADSSDLEFDQFGRLEELSGDEQERLLQLMSSSRQRPSLCESSGVFGRQP